jgi:hypothetical protein
MDNLWQFTFAQKDYAQREDSQDEADPTRREKRFTGFTGLRAAGENKVYSLRFTV